ncbi:helix-turn-helix transcriptional regulator [Chroococcidiopsis sp.]|uniref:helix-turn-helix transcriptional regulator n=1 Tax=Chroococcidiopsis sp. TaxID=3088168 RepID=UPI003F37B722
MDKRVKNLLYMRSPMMELRKKSGLKAEQVAVELDIAMSTVRNWEQGKTIPKLRIDQFVKLCQLYDCTLEELYKAVKSIYSEANTLVA